MRKAVLTLAGMIGVLVASGTTCDETCFVHDPATGLLQEKIYADGHEISYTYTDWGYPKRITYASGKWMERFYNLWHQTVSNVYSSANTPAVFVSPNGLGTITRAADSGGLVYDYGERWYSVALRRWINRDPLGEDGGLNLYAFCNNDPVNTIDPNGCIPLDTVWDLANVIYDICVGDEVALAADTAALFIPYVPAGATKLVKAARLSKVEKICPGVKKLEVTYEYLPARFYKDGRHTLAKSAFSNPKWWKLTENGSSKFLPGWGDAEIKGLIEEAFSAAKKQGKIKPSELDGFIYDAGRLVGASKGKKTTRIKIHVNTDGRNLHAFPVP